MCEGLADYLGCMCNKLDFETSKALDILASCWPLQGDFKVSPEIVWIVFVWLFSSLTWFGFKTVWHGKGL